MYRRRFEAARSADVSILPLPTLAAPCSRQAVQSGNPTDRGTVAMTHLPGSRPGRWVFLGIGWTSVGLGCLGLVLPLLPTTPFLLLAAWAFGRSSTRWQHWLRRHPRLGPLIRGWEDHRVIPPWAKGAASAAIAGSFAWLTVSRDWPLWVDAVMAAILGCVLVWIVSRPSRPPAP